MQNLNDSKLHLMKQLPRVSVSKSRKVNLGNYQTEDVFISVQADLDGSANVSQQLEDLLVQANTALDKEVEAIEEKNKK